MADNIAKLNVMITANAQPFDKSVADAGVKIQQFTQLANSVKAGGVTGIVQSIGAMGGLNLSRPLEGILNVASNIPGPIGAIAGTISHVLPALQEAWNAASALLEAGRQNMKELVQLQKRYNLTGAAAAGFRMAVQTAGMTLDEASPIIGRVQRALGQAGAGSAEAQRQFARLRLDGLALSRMPLDEALGRLAQRFKEIKDPNERAAAAAQIFGRNWQDALKLLNKFADGEEFRRMAVYFNTVISAADAARYQAHKEAGERLSASSAATGQGFTQQLYSMYAPVLTFFTEAGTRGLEALQPFLREILRFIAMAAAPLQGIAGLISGLVESIQPLWQAILEGYADIDKAFKELFGDQGGIFEMMKGIGSFIAQFIKPAIVAVGTAIRAVVQLIIRAMQIIREARELMRGVPLVGNWLAGERPGTPRPVNAEQSEGLALIREQIESQIENMRRQRAGLGGSSIAGQLMELRGRGAPEQMLQQLRDANTEFQVARVNQQLRDQVNQLTLTGEGWQQLQLRREGAGEAELAEVRRMQERVGIIQQYLQLQREAASRRDATALTAGSRGAIEAIHRFQRGAEAHDPATLMRQAIERHAEMTERNTTQLRELQETLREAGVVTIGDMGVQGG